MISGVVVGIGGTIVELLVASAIELIFGFSKGEQADSKTRNAKKNIRDLRFFMIVISMIIIFQLIGKN